MKLAPLDTLRAVGPSHAHRCNAGTAQVRQGTVIAPCAAVSAVLDALSPLGVMHIDMPAMPARVWAAIAQARCAKNS
jgi:hypothetical protein